MVAGKGREAYLACDGAVICFLSPVAEADFGGRGEIDRMPGIFGAHGRWDSAGYMAEGTTAPLFFLPSRRGAVMIEGS